MALPGLRDLSPHWPERLAGLWGERVAVVDPDSGTRVTYAELAERSRLMAGGLHAAGVGPGDRVAALMQNGVPLLTLLFACGHVGAMLAPLNWRLSRPELATLLNDLGPRLVVADREFADLAPGAVSPELAAEPPPLASVQMDDGWLILFTGGTTGRPKGAVLTHGSITWNAINTVVSWGLSAADVAPSFTPMFHTGGWNVFTLPLLLFGGRVLLPQRFEPESALRILERERPSVLFMVPTMFRMVAELPRFRDADLSSLRWAISGGAPLSEAVARLWLPKVRVFKQGYGLTEVGPNNFATPDEDALRNVQHSVGKLTYFAWARIVDDNGNDLPPNSPGELWLAGPHACGGYWRRPEATAQAFAGGWFHTGDIAQRDEQGFYYIVDRKKDMIITGGENVYPSEVEEAMYGHPAVREVAVVGIPDETWGEAVTAVLSLKPATSVTPDELRNFLQERLARYKIPKRFIVVPDVPKSAAGKILRTEARAIAEKE